MGFAAMYMPPKANAAAFNCGHCISSCDQIHEDSCSVCQRPVATCGFDLGACPSGGLALVCEYEQ